MKTNPIALTIAGSDSGGGAGIQVDLKTFAALQVHGVSAITCLTAQNPKKVYGVQPTPPEFLKLQLQAIADGFRANALKTGMLYSRALIATVIEFISNYPTEWVVVDPVMVSTSGATLLKPDAVSLMTRRLLPMADLITPNLDEAKVLAEMNIKSPEDMRAAAHRIHWRFGCSVLVKGGHLKGADVAIDLLFDGTQEWLLSAPYIRGISTHGTGCTYSAAITGHLARGRSLLDAVVSGKEYVSQAIASSRKVGKLWVLGG